MRQSIEAWNKEWAKLRGPALKERRDEYHRDYLDDTLRQLLAWIDPRRHRRFLEIGCGPAILGEALARRGFQVAGLDCCIEALKAAGRVHRGLRRPSFFVGGDLNHIPLRDGSVDFLYGGGVIEHFDDTLGCLRELHRVLAPGGVSFNTVPYFSVGSLTYRQRWGNIPDVPLLKPLAEWVHLRLLGGRHMKYGYEKSFTARRMRQLHLQAGFERVEVRRFEVFLPLHHLPASFKAAARRLTRWRPFWPMIAVVGINIKGKQA
jgi:ubiquinone/menaquinone biosynthesis C-methylase UbiE